MQLYLSVVFILLLVKCQANDEETNLDPKSEEEVTKNYDEVCTDFF
jgi:hypothetical protein